MVAIGWYDEDDAESALQSDAPKASVSVTMMPTYAKRKATW